MAAALLGATTKPAFIVTLAVADKLMSYLVSASRQLQAADLNIAQALATVNAARFKLGQIREEAAPFFRTIFEEAQARADEWGVEITMPRRVGRQTTRDNIEADTAEIYYRRSTFVPFLDFLLKELETRFGEPPIVYQLQELLPAFMTVEAEDKVMEAAAVYLSDLDAPIQVVRCQVDIWVSLMRREDSSESSLANCVQLAQSRGLNHVVMLLKLFGTIPVTTASAERSFSALKRLKTHLRSTKSEERLNGLALLATRQFPVDTDAVLDKEIQYIYMYLEWQKSILSAVADGTTHFYNF